MTQPTSIKIDNVEYVRKDSVAAPVFVGDIKIVILDRGYVYIGAVKIEGESLVIRNAKHLRVMGTTKGIGELINGPTEATRLDAVGTVRAHLRAVSHTIEVEQSKWNASQL